MDFTVDDPQTYTKPWTVTLHFLLAPDTELIEHVCENEKDSRHEVGRVPSDEPAEVKVAPETLAKYAGSYKFALPDSDSQVLEVNLVGSRLGFLGAELTPVSETEFAAPGGYLTFAIDGKGNVTQLTLIRENGPGPNHLKGVRR